MITHTPFTIGDRYALIGSFSVPDVPGQFEVRTNSERVKRPMLIVVHDNWHEAGRRDRITPVIVIQFEADGREKCIEQKEAMPSKTMNLTNLRLRAIQFFQQE
ncbi:MULTISPECIES: hypothetical protein [Xenorhabdus]|uniref:hypothetical protein n=1 Tax=Xenorhabdus TaxID=626 RepID=UPI00064B154A|nr:MULTISPECIES: hypothetical protein [Xenorhabdus]KLU17168.1 hypothetical protein AAY47_01765 [Xenorhabdus griffiniae]KOP32757.1 hypothetical protein AFK69_13695 [Xenorhabdus sp. GDc328]